MYLLCFVFYFDHRSLSPNPYSHNSGVMTNTANEQQQQQHSNKTETKQNGQLYTVVSLLLFVLYEKRERKCIIFIVAVGFLFNTKIHPHMNMASYAICLGVCVHISCT